MIIQAMPYPASSTDADFGSTKLLLGFEGADGATATSDESASARGSATFIGNAQLDTSQKKFGSSSLLLDGSGDGISFPDSADWIVGPNGTGAWTWEMWVMFAADANLSAAHTFAGQWTGGGSQRGFIWGYDGTTGGMRFRMSNDGALVKLDKQDAWSPSVLTWYHVAMTRSGDNFRSFVDGNLLSLTTDGTAAGFNSNAVLHIGTFDPTLAGPFKGWIDEVRYTKGVARYTASFSPPTAAFPRS